MVALTGMTPAASSREAAPPKLEMRGIGKTFPGIVALDDVTFACAAGEVHAICGENGAGKSTLMKILGGVYQPDAGEILLDGKPMRLLATRVAARRAGISIIHQELSLCPTAPWPRTSFSARSMRRFGSLDRARHARRRRERWLAPAPIPTRERQRRVSSRSPSSRSWRSPRRSPSTRAFSSWTSRPRRSTKPKPSGSRPRAPACGRRRGASIFISHRMPQVFAIADRITVLKDGV